MSGYNYSKFEATAYDLDQFNGPRPGQKAPDATLTDIEGRPQRLLDFDGDFLVLEMGSITCPLFQGRRGGMAKMVQQFPDTDFSILYVREAHPGAARPKHDSEAGKLSNAKALRSEDHEGRKILIDRLEGEAHKAYGQYPNSVFIINRNGCVVFMADWNNPVATSKALEALKAGKPATGMGMFLPPPLPVALRTLASAGKGAMWDFFSGLPRLAWKNLIKRNLRVALGQKTPIPPDAHC